MGNRGGRLVWIVAMRLAVAAAVVHLIKLPPVSFFRKKKLTRILEELHQYVLNLLSEAGESEWWKRLSVVDAGVCCPDPQFRTKTLTPQLLGVLPPDDSYLSSIQGCVLLKVTTSPTGNILFLGAAPIQCLVSAGVQRPCPLYSVWDIYTGPSQIQRTSGLTGSSVSI